MRLLPTPKSINTKLFLTMLMTSSGVALCMFLVMQWSFDKGFLNYVNTQDKEKTAELGTLLIKEFQSNGSWEKLAGNPRKWHQIISGNTPELLSSGPRPHPSAHRKNHHRPPHFPPRSRDLKEHQPPSPEQRGYPPRRESRQPNPDAKGDQNRANPPPAGHRPPPNQQHPRVILLSAEKSVIFGPPDGIDAFSLVPITLDEQVIGYLGVKPMKELSDAHDLVFVQEQSQTFLIIALAMIGVSIMLSIPVSAHLVKPIKRLAQGTQQLTSGKFDTRIPITTRDELGTLSEDFNTLASTLKENEQARQQWVADISHELRTPLAILKGEIEAIEDGIRKPTTENMASLGQEVNHLSHLVSDLYELSMSDIGALNYQKCPTDILPILQHCTDSFIDPFNSKGISLTFDSMNMEEAILFVDPQRIKQLINNLLKNSFRYTDSGGQSLMYLEKNTSELLIHLQDSSPGVPIEEIPKLFDRLYRVDASRNRASGGAGLGLAICSNIVSAHGGIINAQPSPQHGLWVTVHLPLKRKV